MFPQSQRGGVSVEVPLSPLPLALFEILGGVPEVVTVVDLGWWDEYNYTDHGLKVPL